MTLLSFQPVIWLAITLVAIFCEAIFANLIAVWCAPAAVIALICGFCGFSIWGQSLVFGFGALVMITGAHLVRMILRRHDSHKSPDDGI